MNVAYAQRRRGARACCCRDICRCITRIDPACPGYGTPQDLAIWAEISSMLPLPRDETDRATSFAGNIPRSCDAFQLRTKLTKFVVCTILSRDREGPNGRQGLARPLPAAQLPQKHYSSSASIDRGRLDLCGTGNAARGGVDGLFVRRKSAALRTLVKL
jgi:hypothetical protein